jgi:hypothetical protein
VAWKSRERKRDIRSGYLEEAKNVAYSYSFNNSWTNTGGRLTYQMRLDLSISGLLIKEMFYKGGVGQKRFHIS